MEVEIEVLEGIILAGDQEPFGGNMMLLRKFYTHWSGELLEDGEAANSENELHGGHPESEMYEKTHLKVKTQYKALLCNAQLPGLCGLDPCSRT